MARPSSYPPELRKRAVRRVAEVRSDYPAESATINAVMAKLGVDSRETLRKWVRSSRNASARRWSRAVGLVSSPTLRLGAPL
ncbi:hypothetical protein ACWGQ5_20380 [Streptomyces sp. NPDC055722]